MPVKTAPKGEFAKRPQGTIQIAGYDDRLVVPDDKVLQEKGGDLKIYKDLLRDDQVSATFQQRRDAVTSKEWDVEPASDSALDKAAAAYAKEQLQGLKWDDITDKQLYSVFYGYGVAELMWQRQGNRLGWSEILVRERGRFAWGESGQLYLKKETGNGYDLMPERKFWTLSIGADNHDAPYGLGLAHKLYWPVFFKRNDIKFWLIFLERFSGPTTKATLPRNQYDDEKLRGEVLQQLERLATEGRVVVPEGTRIDFMESIYSGSADYEKMKSAMDAAIAKIVLSQTMTTDDGSSRSQSETHKGVRDEVIKSDADFVCESFNRGPLRWLTEYNFPGAGIPRVWRQTEPEEDINQRAERDKKISELGFEPTEEYIKETYGEGWVKKKAQPIRVPGSATGSVQGEDLEPAFAELSALVSARNAHRADQQTLVEAASRFATQYEDLVGEQVRQLVEYLEETDDLETFRRRLGDLVTERPSPKTVETLERSGFMSRLMGRIRGARS